MSIENQKLPWSYPLTPAALKKWRKKLGYKQYEAARELGIGLSTYKNYERGSRHDGNSVVIPKYVGLSCAAIALGLESVLIKKNLKEWRTSMEFTQDEAAAMLGMSKMKYINHERGYREKGAAVRNPKYLGLAGAAIEYGITDYQGPKTA